MIVVGAASILDRAAETLGDFLPRLGGALVLLVGGLLLVWLFVRLLVRLLLKTGLDRAGERLRVHDVLARAGLERSITRLLAFALRLGLSVVVVFAALSLLGLQFLSEALNEAILFLPQLLLALGLMLTGLVLADLAKERVERLAYQMALPGPLGQAARVAVLAVAGILALSQLGVPTDILTSLGTVLVGGLIATFALAFGLGGRKVAEQVAAGRYLGGVYRKGDVVVIDGLRGEILRIETAGTVIETEDGRTLRMPNERVLRATVEIAGPERSQGQSEPDAS